MKRLLTILLAVTMAISLTACMGNVAPSGSGGDNPGASAKGGASQKADGGEMTDEADNAQYDGFESLSGIPKIGGPVGYSIDESNVIAGEEFHRIFFELNEDEVPQEDIDKFAAAIWNLCIDVAENGALYEYSPRSNEIEKEFKNLSDAKGSSGDYAWDYTYNDMILEIDIGRGYGGGYTYLSFSITVIEELTE